MTTVGADLPKGLRCAPRRFATTRWSLVSKAAAPGGVQALSELCRAYWSPVHMFIKGHGLSSEDAADVTQEFFATLLARNDFAKVDRERGRFRSWLRHCARNYLFKWLAHRRGLAVGGKAVHVSMDALTAELRDDVTPERLFDRHWALTVLDRALDRLRQRYARANKNAIFQHLHGGLSGGANEVSDRELSLVLGKSTGAIKVERHRLKLRFQECLRAEVAETVPADDVDEEIRRLIEALA